MAIYLDYAASAPLRPEAATAWATANAEGNPSSVHGAGRAARATVEAARETIARSFGAGGANVVFTSGGTEADNLALAGIFHARQAAAARPHVVISAIEPHAITAAAELLAVRHGASVTRLAVAKDGIVPVDAVARALEAYGDAIAVISLMGANNETGALQPVAETVRLAADYGVPVHSDWVHLAGKVPLDFGASHLAAASISSHKLGGPVGSGALLVGRHTPLAPILAGGGQERGVRSGTLDARGAAAFAAAARAASGEGLEALFAPLDAWVARSAGIAIARTPPAHVPGTRLLTVPGCSAEILTYVLDREGIAVAAGSACTAGVIGPSHVLEAMGLRDQAASGLRISVGWASTPRDIDTLLAVLPRAIEVAREATTPHAAGTRGLS
ncbi:MAG: cysteine desulfurase [Bifidobacteriaceae bacterium]|nr:cysteine desulfurase [Bifidobacteriaceae bacterium]